MTMTTKMTKAELTARVTELEAELAATQELVREWASYAETTIPADALTTFVASLPRKIVFRALARALHPDMGGDTAAMQALTAAWSAGQR
jgi:hypothetical protein